MSPVKERLNELVGRVFNFLASKRGVLLLLVIIVVSAGYAVFSYTERSPEANKLCTVCHNMQPFYDAVSQTPHGSFNCHVCHELTPEVVKELWIQLTEAPSAEEVKERARLTLMEPCLECHSLQDLASQQIHEAHLGAIDKSSSCNICHNPHAPREIDLACTDCHDAREAREKHEVFHDLAVQQLEKGDYLVCGECHSPEAKWEVPITPDCFAGIIKNQNCFECHEAPLSPPSIGGRPCTECHGAR